MASLGKSWRKNRNYREYNRIQKALSRHFIYYASQVMEPHECLTVSEIADRLNKYLCPTGDAQLTEKTVRTYLQKAQNKAGEVPPFVVLEAYRFNPEYLSDDHWELDPPRPGPIMKKYPKD